MSERGRYSDGSSENGISKVETIQNGRETTVREEPLVALPKH